MLVLYQGKEDCRKYNKEKNHETHSSQLGRLRQLVGKAAKLRDDNWSETDIKQKQMKTSEA